MYTVKQMSDLAGISVRTLHHYDAIGLLKPARVGENGYRFYDEPALLRPQQILFFRELDVPLRDIRAVLDGPGFDAVEALRDHRRTLQARIRRLQTLVDTIDRTMMHLTGEGDMPKKQLFSGFSAEEERRYAEEARQQYGADEVDPSYQRWNSYSPEKREQILAEGRAIYDDLVALIDRPAADPEVQRAVARWHQHLRYFYEPSVERLMGLADLYVNHPEFAKNFAELHPNLAAFMREAIVTYCGHLMDQG